MAIFSCLGSPLLSTLQFEIPSYSSSLNWESPQLRLCILFHHLKTSPLQVIRHRPWPKAETAALLTSQALPCLPTAESASAEQRGTGILFDATIITHDSEPHAHQLSCGSRGGSWEAWGAQCLGISHDRQFGPDQPDHPQLEPGPLYCLEPMDPSKS